MISLTFYSILSYVPKRSMGKMIFLIIFDNNFKTLILASANKTNINPSLFTNFTKIIVSFAQFDEDSAGNSRLFASNVH